MRLRTLFSYFRRKAQSTLPVTQIGLSSSLIGYFELRVDRVVGWVEDIYRSNTNPMQVEFLRGGATIVSVNAVWDPKEDRYVFGFPLEGRLTGAELVREQVIALVSDNEGRRGRILLGGAAQLELIRDHLASPTVTIIDLDFSNGGNSRAYLGRGWSGAERDFTWTEGQESMLSFDTPKGTGTYALRMTAGPYIHRPEVPAQMLIVFLNEMQIGLRVFVEGHTEFYETRFPHDAFGTNSRTTLRLFHPDAARPSDFSVADDRQLAFYFKRLTLVQLQAPD